MRASRHHGDAAEANDIGREVGWPLRQAGLHLSADGGCLPLPVGREADLSLYERGGRQDAAPLLDDGMPALPAQISVYQGTGAAHHAMGARTPARSWQQRLDENPQAMRQRRETVEHPFGTLKMRMGATHFLMNRLPKVATEMALHVLAYNLTRVMNIVGVQPLMAAIRA